MVLSMKVNGMFKLDTDMVEVIKFGVMEVFMKVTGKMIKPMDVVD